MPRLTSVASENSGGIQASCGSDAETLGSAYPSSQASGSAMTMTISGAEARWTMRASRNTPTSGSTRPGAVCAPTNSPSANRSNSPASMPPAIDAGSRAMSAPSAGTTPANVVSSPANMNAPTA